MGWAWTSWSALWRYARSPIVVYGTYATLLIPVIAQGIVFAQGVWSVGVAVVPPVGGVPSPPPTPEQTALVVDAAKALSEGGWRLFAAQFYVAGLLVVAARLLTDLFCPPRIQRFPYEDDHLVFIGGVKQAKTFFEGKQSDSDEKATGVAVIAALGRLITKELGSNSAEAVNSTWRKDNYARPWLRGLTAGLYALGTAGVVLFLLWRTAQNARAVTALFGL